MPPLIGVNYAHPIRMQIHLPPDSVGGETVVGTSLTRRSVAPNGKRVTSTSSEYDDATGATGLRGGCPVQTQGPVDLGQPWAVKSFSCPRVCFIV